MVNEFFGFSPEAFEQFVRALSLVVFGPGVTAFGNGPDGGREATFRGTVPYPHPPVEQWSGYGVIQAKCKEKLETAEKDQAWALALLKDELTQFAQPAGRRQKPDYYVFVTNVELSSVTGGGRDSAEHLLSSFSSTPPLAGYAVWDANQLRALMAVHGELRRRFQAFLTDGDVLSALLANLAHVDAVKKEALVAFLERRLRADEASRLDQAGSRTEEQLRLAELFFDLPASVVPELAPPTEGLDAQGRLPHGILYDILRAASRKLDPKALYDQEESTASQENRFPTSYVLLGGPGSGKSTVGQFLAQIHRSALLKRVDPARLVPQTRRIIDETWLLCEREGLPWPATPRYPLRVELNRFAKALSLSEGSPLSLTEYLARQIGAGRHLSADDLRACLGECPWVLILDGLDEVPATSNRTALVAAVKDFLSEARHADADLFVLTTSRQQGYAGEFDDGAAAIRHILPLSTLRALKYVERYATARFHTTDPNKAKDIVDRLHESAARELTAQLMTSPLQVTFMVTVVAARGEPGEDRWQLFDSYYRTVYDRERQKAVPPYDSVLSRQQSLIDRLHHDIGFWLQYRGETAGGTASLPIARFENLLDRYLSELGHDAAEKTRLAALITGAARQRLVFLTSRVEGELSFDVRSLQEYMAAECLTSGPPNDIKRRLRAIAVAPYWRNVLLFAASKCFSSAGLRHMQADIQLLCSDLNESPNRLVSATKTGSELALDILQGGAVTEHHNHARALASIALDLLGQQVRSSLDGDAQQVGPTIDRQIASVYSGPLEPVYREKLGRKLDQEPVGRTLPAWMTLAWLVHERIDWARELAEARWPSPEQASAILGGLPGDCLRTDWLLAKGASTALRHSPSAVFELCPWVRRSWQGQTSPLSAILAAAGIGKSLLWTEKLEAQLRGSQGHLPGLHVYAVRAGRWHAEDIEPHSPRPIPPAWLPYALASEFIKSPTPDSLGWVLEECTNRGWVPQHDAPIATHLPWQLAGCLNAARSPQEMHEVAAAARAGSLGDASAWRSAEDRWRQEGVSLEELSIAAPSGASAVERARIALRYPTAAWYSVISGQVTAAALRETLDAALATEQGDRSRMLAWMFLVGARDTKEGICGIARPAEMRQLFESSRAQSIHLEPATLGDFANAIPPGEWLELLDSIGRSEKLGGASRPAYYPMATEAAWCVALQKAVIGALPPRLAPGRYRLWGRRAPLGVLRILGRWAAEGHHMDLIPGKMLDHVGSLDPSFQFAALLVRISRADWGAGHAEHLADRIVSLLTSSAEPDADALVAAALRSCLRTRAAARSVMTPLLLRMHRQLIQKGEPFAAECRQLLCQFRQSESSDLQAGGMLTQLGLPTFDA